MLLARNETTGSFEVYDEQGFPVGRVTLPTDTRLFGMDTGTVYLQRPLLQPVQVRPRGPAQAA